MRIEKLDVLRGLAVVLMVLDHVLHVGREFWGWSPWCDVLRVTVTRPALPIFMLVAGYLWDVRGVRLRRLGLVLAVAIASAGIEVELRMGQPGILTCYLFVAFVCWRGIVVAPVLSAVIGFLLAWNLPLFGGKAYELGYVMGWCSIGVLWSRADRARSADLLPPPSGVAVGGGPVLSSCMIDPAPSWGKGCGAAGDAEGTPPAPRWCTFNLKGWCIVLELLLQVVRINERKRRGEYVKHPTPERKRMWLQAVRLQEFSKTLKVAGTSRKKVNRKNRKKLATA